VIALAILLGVGLGFTPLDPIKALLWSAVVNGVIVVPIMAAMMIMASRRKLMGRFVASPWQLVLGWAATAVMTAAAVAMFVMM
jgi:Mn2+/Fe2+ NRAMP family transporter